MSCDVSRLMPCVLLLFTCTSDHHGQYHDRASSDHAGSHPELKFPHPQDKFSRCSGRGGDGWAYDLHIGYGYGLARLGPPDRKRAEHPSGHHDAQALDFLSKFQILSKNFAAG